MLVEGVQYHCFGNLTAGCYPARLDDEIALLVAYVAGGLRFAANVWWSRNPNMSIASLSRQGMHNPMGWHLAIKMNRYNIIIHTEISMRKTSLPYMKLRHLLYTTIIDKKYSPLTVPDR